MARHEFSRATKRAALAHSSEVKMQSELKPCPFCGGKAVTKVHKGHARTSIPGFSGAQFFRGHVKCTNCGVTTPQAKNPQAMTEAWNRRAALAATRSGSAEGGDGA